MPDSKQHDTPAAMCGNCPICGRPQVPEYNPFCSKRCADIDLGRWLNGVYAIPATPDEEEDEMPSIPDAANDSGRADA